MQDVEKIVEDCKNRWGIIDSEARINEFETKLPDFLNEFSGEELEIIVPLIYDMVYYSHKKINTLLTELHSKVTSLSGYNENSTVFCVLKSKQGKINSSTEYMCEYWRLNKVNTYSVITNIDELDPLSWEYIDTVVLVDDFCGSGDTFIDFIKAHKNLVQRKNVVYAAIHMMQDAITKIEKFASNSRMNIKPVYCKSTDKAFDNLDNDDIRLKFLEISQKVGIVNEKNDVWGYKKTEALIAYYNNTPNNTLGLFRKDTEKNKAIFPRRNEMRPGWLRQMQEEKKRRQVSNYRRKAKSCNE